MFTNFMPGFKCGNYQVTQQYSSIFALFTTCQDTAMSCQLSEVGRLKRLFTCTIRRRFASCSSFKHFITCKLKDFGNPGTIGMLGKFSETLDHVFKYIVVSWFGSSYTYNWNVAIAFMMLNVNLCDFRVGIWWWNEALKDPTADWKIATLTPKIFRSTKTIQRRSSDDGWCILTQENVDARLSNHSIWRQTSIAM